MRLSLDVRSRAKELGWTFAFLAILAVLLFPAILLSAGTSRPVSVWEQAGLIALATVVIQLLRRQPILEVTGRPGVAWLRNFAAGIGLGGALMLAPALFLWLSGWVTFQAGESASADVLNAVALMAGVALAEELLFRGVLFQRLIDAFGFWPAQLTIAALFALTHLGNPGMVGTTKLWAGTNIFLASVLLGLAYRSTRSLAMPIGLHFMANTMQGVILGFGVSGTHEARVLEPKMLASEEWLTGGTFGLEASLPGLVALVVLILALLNLRSDAHRMARPFR